jgi:hypothetical protein
MMEYHFTLKYRLSDHDNDHAALVDRLGEAGCTDALVGIGLQGFVVLDFTRVAADAKAAMFSALADVKKALPTATLIEASPDCEHATISHAVADAYRAMLAAAPPQATQSAEPLRVTARPIVWERDGDQWTESEYGFYITLDDPVEDDTPYFAAWGEGDEDRFASLEEAQAWCQRTIDRWVAHIAIAAPQDAGTAATGDGRGV